MVKELYSEDYGMWIHSNPSVEWFGPADEYRQLLVIKGANSMPDCFTFVNLEYVAANAATINDLSIDYDEHSVQNVLIHLFHAMRGISTTQLFVCSLSNTKKKRMIPCNLKDINK